MINWALLKSKQQCGGSQRKKGVGTRWRWAKWEERGQKDFAWGDGHMTQCTDDVLFSCTLETHMVLQTNVNQWIQLIKKEIKSFLPQKMLLREGKNKLCRLGKNIGTSHIQQSTYIQNTLNTQNSIVRK